MSFAAWSKDGSICISPRSFDAMDALASASDARLLIPWVYALEVTCSVLLSSRALACLELEIRFFNGSRLAWSSRRRFMTSRHSTSMALTLVV